MNKISPKQAEGRKYKRAEIYETENRTRIEKMNKKQIL